MGDDQDWITLPDGRRVPTGRKKGNGAVAGAAVAIVLAALAGGGAGGVAAAASGAADKVSAGPRASQSQDADEFNLKTRSQRGRTEISVRGSNDEVKATLRLRQLGQHPTGFESELTSDCPSFSSGEIRTFLTNHHCVSLNRTFVEIGEKAYAIQFFIATIQMPDDRTAADLHALFLRDGTGNMKPLSPKSGKYRHIPVTDAPPSKTTLHDDTVINIQGRGLGRTPGAALTSSLATSVLFNLDTM